MSRLNIAVLFGGCAPEYGVSLQSAAAVLRHMDKGRYEPVMVGISQAGTQVSTLCQVSLSMLSTGPV